MRTPATLQAAVETETDQGGRVRAWADLGLIWIAFERGGAASESSAGDLPPTRVETATALAHDDPRAAAGCRLALDGEPPWTVSVIQRATPEPGRMILRLQRTT